MTLIQNIKQNHFLITTALLLVVLPYKKLVVPVLLLNIASYLLNESISKKLIQLKQNKYFWLFVLPFLMYLAGMIYSDNQPFGWKDIELKLSLLIFPLLYASTTFQFHQYKKTLALVYVISMSFSALISIIYGSISFGQLPTYNMMDLLLHPSYLAMYANLALVVCYFLLNDNALGKEVKRGLWAAFIILSITTLLTLSKTGILIWIILIGGMFLYPMLVLKKQYKLSIVIALTGFAILYAAYQFIPRVKDRVEVAYSAIVKAEEKVDVRTVESTQVRMLIWEQTTQIIKENTLFGVGTGDIKDELYVKYKSAGMQGALENKLNVHNQYLQVFATLGLLGILLFVSSFMFPFISAYKQNNKYYLAFMVIFSINILFESMLEKQDGVIFYAFFNALFFFHFKPKISQQSFSES